MQILLHFLQAHHHPSLEHGYVSHKSQACDRAISHRIP